ncbi:rCG62904 [Rattus norvegicus]|uniref:RCG62904 n=1 Tax=Rattus norvegicus TaxID=10116 RepID=A6KRB4_RAT|nr:rCG62904 [Rattus norvegicus]
MEKLDQNCRPGWPVPHLCGRFPVQDLVLVPAVDGRNLESQALFCIDQSDSYSRRTAEDKQSSRSITSTWHRQLSDASVLSLSAFCFLLPKLSAL